MINIHTRRIVLNNRIAPEPLAAWGDAAETPAETTCVEVGSASAGNRTSFLIPKALAPEVHESSFRIVLDCSSMMPTVTDPGSRAWESALDIQVHGYRDGFGNDAALFAPPFGTRDQIVHGFAGQFYFDCFFSKALTPQFREIDQKVSKLLHALHQTRRDFRVA
jgi:hypothetical protein